MLACFRVKLAIENRAGQSTVGVRNAGTMDMFDSAIAPSGLFFSWEGMGRLLLG